MRKLSQPQITNILKRAGLKQILNPDVHSSEKRNSFWFDSRDLVITTDAAETRATKALREVGHPFGGFKTGWGVWILRENYQSNPLVDQNID